MLNAVRNLRKVPTTTTTTTTMLRKTLIRSLISREISKTAILKDIFTIQDTEDFKKKVLESKTPVLVDFYADWCAPCRNLGPRLEHLVGCEGDQLHLAKINVDQHTDLAMEYDVTAVPAVIGMKNGKIVDRFIGLVDDDKLKSFAQRIKCS